MEVTMEMEVQQLPSMRLACVRHVGPYWQIGAAFKQLDTWAAEHGLAPMTLVALYHDDPTAIPEAELQSDAAVVLPDGQTFTANRGMAITELPTGTYAMTTHVGPYSELPRAWAEFYERFQNSGRRLRQSPAMEIYGSMKDVPAHRLVTKLYLPIEA